MNNLLTKKNYRNICDFKVISQFRHKILFFALVSLLSGLLIYAFFRNHNMMIFHVFAKPLFLETIYFSVPADNIFISMFLFNLPDGLWFLSGLLAIRAVWLTNPKWRFIYFCVFLVTALFMEIMQISAVLPGTFDILDIVFIAFFAFFENFIFYMFIKRRIL